MNYKFPDPNQMDRSIINQLKHKCHNFAILEKGHKAKEFQSSSLNSKDKCKTNKPLHKTLKQQVAKGAK